MKRLKNFWDSAKWYVRSYFLFFGIISFVITCTFLISFSTVELAEEDVRTFAPIAFYNIFVLTTLFWGVDVARRIVTVERPSKKIQRVLQSLMEGDFSARTANFTSIDREGRFREIAKSIDMLAEELSGVETLRTDFIANVSHELKTPLAVIQNYGTMLQTPGLSEEKRLEYSKAITDASRRLANLITNILKLNKLENQQIFPSMEEYNLSEQLCECLLQFEDAWEKKQINIETEIEDEIMIRSDAELLSLVWNNLFSNAIKFTELGGTVSVSLKMINNIVEVKVSDTGCGMTPDVGAHIFEKFYQGDTSRATQGNGLGLALVKRVVDIMQGEIQVDSILGEGSTFTVRIGRR